MSILSNNFFKQVVDATKKDEKQTRMAVVDSINDDSIFLKFYGEETASYKPYKRISSYDPSVGDVVILSKVGSSYIITGKVV